MTISSDPISSLPISAERTLAALIVAAVGFYDSARGPVSARNFTDQQQFSSFQPAGNIGSPPNGASGNYDTIRAPTTSRNFTDQQQFLSFGTIVSTTPQGWMPIAAEATSKRSPSRLTDFMASTALVATSAMTSPIWGAIDAARIKPSKAAAQQHLAWTGYQVPAAGVEGWQSASPEIVQRTFVIETEQTLPPTAPTATTATFVPSLEDFVVSSRVILGETELPVFQVPIAGTGVWWQPFAEARARPFRRDSFEVSGTLATTIVAGWQQPFADAKRRPFERDSFEVLATAAATQPQGWLVDQQAPRTRRQSIAQDAPFVASPFDVARGSDISIDDVVKTRPLTATALRSFEVLPVYQIPTATTPQGWAPTLFDARVRPLRASLQTYDMASPLVSAAAATPGPIGWTIVLDWITRRPTMPVTSRPSDFAALYQAPTAATPQGWWQPLADARVKPFKASLQVHAYFQPQGTITDAAASSIGWQTASPEYVQSTFVHEHDVWQATTPPAQTTPSMAWAVMAEPPPRKIRPVRHAPQFGLSAFTQPFVEPVLPLIRWRQINATQQQHATYLPQGAIVSITPQGFHPTLFEAHVRPVKAALQLHTTFQPAGDIATAVAGSIGWDIASPEIFAYGYALAEQQGWLPTGPAAAAATPAFIGWAPSLFDARVRPFKVALQTYATFQPMGDLAITLGWDSASPSVFIWRAFVEHQDWPPIAPTASTTPQGWWQPLEVRYVRPVKASLQQHDAYQDFIPATQAGLGPFGWSYFIDVGKRPRDASRTPFEAHQFIQVTTFAPQGWQPAGFDAARARARLAPVGDTWVPATPLAVTANYGWQTSFADLRPAAVRPREGHAVLPAYQIPVAGTGVWWQPLETRYIRPVRPSVQQYDSWAPFRPPGLQPLGFAQFFDESHVRPVKLTLQQYDTWPIRSPAVLGPWGWTHFVDASRKKPKAEAFAVLQIFGFVDNTTTKGWFPTAWIDPKFHYGCKATLQQSDFATMRSGIFVPPVIVARPTLLGADAAPTLLGTDDEPRIGALYGGVTLKGTVT